MKRRSNIPVTLTKNPEPKKNTKDWVIWAAWADRITFEEIHKKTGLNEKEVKKIMRASLRTKSYVNWRKRVNSRTTKHKKLFTESRNKSSHYLD